MDLSVQTELRVRLLKAGYSPLPLQGKVPPMEGWQQKTLTNVDEIKLWSNLYPGCSNTGVLTRLTPTIDIDIMDQAAAEAVEDLAREWFEERGRFLVRTGKAPKRAVLLRTPAPFKKVTLKLIAPNGATAKVEILADGQQVVVAGDHPETMRPYSWHGGELWTVAADELPDISEAEAHAFKAKAGELLAQEFGYTVVEAATNPNGANGHDHATPSDWGDLLSAILTGTDLHDATTALAGKLIVGGLSGGASVRLLRAIMGASAAPHDSRWQDRYADLPRAVRTAREKFAPHQPQQSATHLGEFDAGDDPGWLDPRAWLMALQFCRGFISSVVAAGGTGKTALRLLQFISLALGRSLCGQHVFRRCRVLLISLEDDRTELQRRIKAVLDHYKINRSELKGWLFCASPKLAKLAHMDNWARKVGPLEQQIRDAIVRRQPDIVSLDPFIKTHSLEENDSADMDFVCDLLARLAVDYNIAVDSPHHVHKGHVTPGDADSGRGSSGIRDAGRLVYTLCPMSADEAAMFNIPHEDRAAYVRLDPAKVNIAPRAARAEWFQLIGVPIGNGTAEYPAGDTIQVAAPWTPPDLWGGTKVHELNDILSQISRGPLGDDDQPTGQRYSTATNAGDRAAWKVIHEKYPDKNEQQCREMIRAWVDSGLLKFDDYFDPVQRKQRKGLHVDDTKRPS